MNKLEPLLIRLASLISVFMVSVFIVFPRMNGALFFSAFSGGTILGNIPSWAAELG
jgi:hypothetical protein